MRVPEPRAEYEGRGTLFPLHQVVGNPLLLLYESRQYNNFRVFISVGSPTEEAAKPVIIRVLHSAQEPTM